MAQGKLKVKAKLPQNVKGKAKSKGPAVTKRNNRPVKAKTRNQEHQKLKQAITKNVNKIVEEEIRAQTNSTATLSKAQKAVANYHETKNST